MLIMTENKSVRYPWNQVGEGDLGEFSIPGKLITDRCWSLRYGERSLLVIYLLSLSGSGSRPGSRATATASPALRTAWPCSPSVDCSWPFPILILKSEISISDFVTHKLGTHKLVGIFKIQIVLNLQIGYVL